MESFVIDSPTKLDNDVLLALTGLEIDQQLYPCIAKWRNTVVSYPEPQRQRWPGVKVTANPNRLTRSWLTGSPSFLGLRTFNLEQYP
ncbi:hypothetical protein P4O66_005979 [Electrophorus voltai]|uniref:Uncharacterized protein n=1 Tax=Electrophorus voltai TaxID=2609070 RepID=A0AAD8ZMJ1_9TELE|nr:hypothetical protein P4O66_005979 [Electrophorus voltai]